MEAVPNFPQLSNCDGTDPLDARKQDRNRFLRTMEVLHKRRMIETCSVPVLAPDGSWTGAIYVPDSCNPNDSRGWAGGIYPEPRAIDEFWNAAAQLNSLCSVQDCIRVTGTNGN